MAMLTLIDSTVSATIRQSDSEPIASEAATALINRDEATGAAGPSSPAARGDRVMAEIPQDPQANHLRNPVFAAIAGKIWAAPPENVTERWRLGLLYPLFSAVQASAAMLAEAVTSRSGHQSMETKPGICSTRRSQLPIEGKAARSKSH